MVGSERAGNSFPGIHEDLDAEVRQASRPRADQGRPSPAKRISGHRKLDGGRNSLARKGRAAVARGKDPRRKARRRLASDALRCQGGTQDDWSGRFRSAQRLVTARAMESRRTLSARQIAIASRDDRWPHYGVVSALSALIRQAPSPWGEIKPRSCFPIAPAQVGDFQRKMYARVASQFRLDLALWLSPFKVGEMPKRTQTMASLGWKLFPVALAILTAVVFSKSIRPTHQHFDYTYRIAGAFMHGHLGLSSQPPSWLNEMVPMGRHYYSVFPLGAVLSVLPFALLGEAGWWNTFPGGGVASLIAGLCVYSLYQLAGFEPISKSRRILLALFPVFGTWTWCNLGFGGAWQIALGFALLGQVAALYFTLVQRKPFLAGACFALAFGNRTELILTLPIYLYFLSPWPGPGLPWRNGVLKGLPRAWWKPSAWFIAIPVALGLCTAAYNFARFDSIFDFGYARIVNLAQEPWYRVGYFRSTPSLGTFTRCYLRVCRISQPSRIFALTLSAAQFF